MQFQFRQYISAFTATAVSLAFASIPGVSGLEVQQYVVDDAEYQTGIRLHLPDAGVEVDLSWGGHMEVDRRGAGFTVGAQFVSGRVF